MEETKSLILQGCKLVRDLESNFPSLNSNQMDPKNVHNDIVNIKTTCEDIISKFRLVIQSTRSNLQGPWPSPSPLSLQIGTTNTATGLRTGMMLAPPYGHEQEEVLNNGRLGVHIEGKGGEDPSLLGDVSLQSRKRRREVPEKRVVEVPAVEFGNAEMPPEDGHTWRKYGQKVILGSNFPRSYYRCTYQKYCNCQAKKQVKKLDNDPTKFEVIYIGRHTCHHSSTAPILAPAFPPQPLNFTNCHDPHQNAPNIIYSTWPYLNFHFSGGKNEHSSSNNRLDGRSTSKGARASQHDVESEYTVANMANGMFNSNIGHANNMDCIFQLTKGKDKNKMN